jgi:hypothetical protein
MQLLRVLFLCHWLVNVSLEALASNEPVLWWYLQYTRFPLGENAANASKLIGTIVKLDALKQHMKEDLWFVNT